MEKQNKPTLCKVRLLPVNYQVCEKMDRTNGALANGCVCFITAFFRRHGTASRSLSVTILVLSFSLFLYISLARASSLRHPRHPPFPSLPFPLSLSLSPPPLSLSLLLSLSLSLSLSSRSRFSLSIYLSISRARALSLRYPRHPPRGLSSPDLCPDANEYSMLTATMAREQKARLTCPPRCCRCWYARICAPSSRVTPNCPSFLISIEPLPVRRGELGGRRSRGCGLASRLVMKLLLECARVLA